MIKIILLFLFICLPKFVAQQGIVVFGGTILEGKGPSTYSVRLVTYINSILSNGPINKGIRQPFRNFILGANDFLENTLTMNAFSNRTTSTVNLSIHNYISQPMPYQFD